MKRREAIKLGIYSSLGISLIPTLSQAQNLLNWDEIQPINSRIKLMLNDIEIYIICDGSSNSSMPEKFLAPKIPKETLYQEMEKLYLNPQNINNPVHVILVKRKDQMILMDAGNGLQRNGWLLGNLKDLNISTDAITDVLITHAHGDHISGLMNEDQLIFGEAKYYIAQEEFDYWSNLGTDKAKTQHNLFELLGSKLTKFKPYTQFFDFIDSSFAPGHTPGHTIFTINDEGKKITFMADLVHSPVVVKHPTWGVVWDVDFDLAAESRQKVLDEMAKEKRLLMATHLPFPGLGFVEKEGNGFNWIPFALGNPVENKL